MNTEATFPAHSDTPLSDFLDDLLGFFEAQDGDITIDEELAKAFIAGLDDAKNCAELLERFALAQLNKMEAARNSQVLEAGGNVVIFPVTSAPALREGGAA